MTKKLTAVEYLDRTKRKRVRMIIANVRKAIKNLLDDTSVSQEQKLKAIREAQTFLSLKLRDMVYGKSF